MHGMEIQIAKFKSIPQQMFSAAFGVDVDFAFAQMRKNWQTNFAGIEFCEDVVTFFSIALFAVAFYFLFCSGCSIEVAIVYSAIVTVITFCVSLSVLKIIKFFRDFTKLAIFKLPTEVPTDVTAFRTRTLVVPTPPAIFALAA